MSEDAPIPRLTLTGIRKVFGPTVALDGVDLAVDPGTCLAVIGENGAGKSTLMKVISGAHAADAGTMHLDGAPFAPTGPEDARRRGVAIVYQELTIVPHLTVAENIVLGNEPRRFGLVDAARRDAIAREALDRLGVAGIALEAVAGTLTVAKRQLVEIARALALGIPRVLVLDEPTASLNATDAAHLFTAIDRLMAAGAAVLFISHHLEECRRVASRWLVLRDGASVGAGVMGPDTTEEALIRLMVGREVADLYPRVPHAIGEPVLTVTNAAGQDLPVEASFTLHRGEILGIFGLVGAGRTELLRTIFGLDRLRGGSVSIAGPATPRGRLDAGLGFVSEDRKDEGLALGLPIADNLTLPHYRPYTRWGLVDRRAQEAATATWMERLAVKAAGPSQPIGQLSGGNQQKVALGRLLHHEARILLLDEPTRGIDVGAKAHLYRQMSALAAEGRSLVIVSSHLPELLGLCDTIAVMRRGRLSTPRPVGAWDAQGLLAVALEGA